jgi:hypothetical protein
VGDSLRGYEAYQQYIIMLDSIHHLEKNEALLSFQLAYNQEENENRIATLAGQVTRYSSSLILILIVLLMVIAVSLFLIIRYRSAINRLHSKSSLLEKEMGSMRAQQIIGLLPTEHPDENNQLCRYRLEAYLQSPLNDTDWNLLTTLTENPNLSNPQLARNLSLSYEGLRSALKKMYRLFQIDESVSNKRVALLAAIMTANNYNQEEEKR